MITCGKPEGSSKPMYFQLVICCFVELNFHWKHSTKSVNGLCFLFSTVPVVEQRLNLASIFQVADVGFRQHSC